jgi:predicted enzyme related to lactoylglutathione lyase
MNKIFFSIPITKLKYQECIDFYSKNFGFKRKSEDDFYLTNEEYPGIGLGFIYEKNHKSENCYLFFEIEKNLPSLFQKIKSNGHDIDIIENISTEGYTARVNDPSGNLVQIYCSSIFDEFGSSFEVLKFD